MTDWEIETLKKVKEREKKRSRKRVRVEEKLAVEAKGWKAMLDALQKKYEKLQQKKADVDKEMRSLKSIKKDFNAVCEYALKQPRVADAVTQY